jgi:hypothetical protein
VAVKARVVHDIKRFIADRCGFHRAIILVYHETGEQSLFGHDDSL